MSRKNRTTGLANGRRTTSLAGVLAGVWTGAFLCLACSIACGQPLARPGNKDGSIPWMAAGDSLLSLGKLEQANAQYLAQAQLHGEESQLWVRIAFVRLQLGQAPGALEAARTARALAPDEPDATLLLGQAELASGAAETGVATLEEGVRRFPDNRPILESLASLCLGRQDWTKAVGLLRQLVQLDPKNPAYRLDLGRILVGAGERDEARTHLRAALDNGADASTVHAWLGEAAFAEGKGDEAAAEYRASNAATPNARAWVGLGNIQFIAGKTAEAETAFRKAIELDPDNGDLYFNLANALVQLDRPADAEQALRKSIAMAPAVANAHLNLGILLINRGAVTDAREQLGLAARLDSKLAGPHLHLARIAAAQYHYDEAQQHYHDYLQRIDDVAEKERISKVLVELQTRMAQQSQARAKGEVHLLQMMVETREQAEQIAQRARAGDDFYRLAQAQSKIASMTGIDVGFVDPAAMHDDFKAAVSRLEVGAITAPLPGRNGFYIFKRVQ